MAENENIQPEGNAEGSLEIKVERKADLKEVGKRLRDRKRAKRQGSRKLNRRGKKPARKRGKPSSYVPPSSQNASSADLNASPAVSSESTSVSPAAPAVSRSPVDQGVRDASGQRPKTSSSGIPSSGSASQSGQVSSPSSDSVDESLTQDPVQNVGGSLGDLPSEDQQVPVDSLTGGDPVSGKDGSSKSPSSEKTSKDSGNQEKKEGSDPSVEASSVAGSDPSSDFGRQKSAQDDQREQDERLYGEKEAKEREKQREKVKDFGSRGMSEKEKERVRGKPEKGSRADRERRRKQGVDSKRTDSARGKRMGLREKARRTMQDASSMLQKKQRASARKGAAAAKGGAKGLKGGKKPSAKEVAETIEAASKKYFKEEWQQALITSFLFAAGCIITLIQLLLVETLVTAITLIFSLMGLLLYATKHGILWMKNTLVLVLVWGPVMVGYITLPIIVYCMPVIIFVFMIALFIVGISGTPGGGQQGGPSNVRVNMAQVQAQSPEATEERLEAERSATSAAEDHLTRFPGDLDGAAAKAMAELPSDMPPNEKAAATAHAVQQAVTNLGACE